jgi:hypothetical protein
MRLALPPHGRPPIRGIIHGRLAFRCAAGGIETLPDVRFSKDLDRTSGRLTLEPDPMTETP